MGEAKERQKLRDHLRLLTVREILDYEVRASWWAGWLSWGPLVRLAAAWFSWKVRRKARRYRLSKDGSVAHGVTAPPMERLSVPGEACAFCGTVIGQPMKCEGCGRVDPLTKPAPAAV